MRFDREGVTAALPAYEIGDELGRGAFGVVIAARHRSLHREVAIKQLPRALAQDKEVRSRFLAEARVLASMNHPHVVPVYDFVEDGQLCLLVMERLTGGTVWERFQEEGVSPQSACAIVVAASAGLHHAHQLGVLHRDVKPDNLMFSSTGILKVADFGIAKVVGGSKSVATAAGMILGTPAYIAPEQVLATSVGPETDVYATATVLYELLAGELPYPPTKTAMDTLRQHVNDDPRPLSALAPRVPRQLAQVVMRGLNKDAADRYPSAKALGDAVALAAADAWGADWLETSGEEVLAGAMPAPPPRPPTRPAPRAPAPPPRPPAGPARPVAPARGRRPVLPLAVAGVVLVAVVAAVAALLTRHDDPQRAITPTTPTSTSVTGTPAPTRQFLTIEYDRATEATQQMYSAWRHGDRAIALQVAAPAAVDQLFRLPFKDGKANECADSSSTEIDCSYEYGTTIIGFRYDVKGRQIIAARPPS